MATNMRRGRYKGTDIPSGQSVRTMLALGRIVNGLEVSVAALMPPLDDEGDDECGEGGAAGDTRELNSKRDASCACIGRPHSFIVC